MPTAYDIANTIDASMRGPDIEVHGARSLKSAERGTVVFLNRRNCEGERVLNSIGEIVCITTPALAENLACTCLLHDQPRLAFCVALAKHFAPTEVDDISTASVVASDADIAPGVTIGAGAAIGPAVKIGPGTRIGSGVVITGRVEIGADCVVRANATIGEAGFGFAIGVDGEPIAFPHIGGIMIGNGVEIGSNCNVARATLDDTVIGDLVKMNSLVHVAHNVMVGARTQVAAGAVICGSVTIGADVWIGPNATIINKIVVGDRAHIGIGSVVTRSLDAGVKVLGNPARKIPSST